MKTGKRGDKTVENECNGRKNSRKRCGSEGTQGGRTDAALGLREVQVYYTLAKKRRRRGADCPSSRPNIGLRQLRARTSATVTLLSYTYLYSRGTVDAYARRNTVEKVR